MRPHRAIIRTAAGTALGLTLLLPAGASANSLLSGYGGPGQGNQAILGSALLKGPSSGGGSGGSSGGNSAGGVSGGAGGSSEPSAGGGASSGRPAAAAPKHAGDASKSAPAAHTDRTLPAASAGAAQGAAALGLSSADALYIILAIGVLAGTGLLTRNLARRTG